MYQKKKGRSGAVMGAVLSSHQIMGSKQPPLLCTQKRNELRSMKM
jgi:hypothetical protein